MYGGIEDHMFTAGQHSALAQAAPATQRRKVSWQGLGLGLTTLLVAASAFPEFRIQAIGLQVHPYLIPMAGLFGILLITNKLKAFPRKILIALFLFTFLYVLSALPGRGAMGESVKMVAAIVTVITAALLVQTKKDFLAGIVGLCLAAAFISIRGLLNFQGVGVGSHALMGIANENATSLYTLPPVLLAGYALREMELPKVIWWMFVGSIVIIGAATFLSANRSGWLGLIIIGAMLLYGSRGKLKMALVLCLIAAAGYYLFTQFDARAFDYSVESTVSRKYSDGARLDMILASVEVGFQNPLLGVSPTELPYEIGTRLYKRWAVYSRNPHNVLGHLIGGCGLITFTLFIYLGFLLWRRPRRRAHQPVTQGLTASQAHWLLRLMIILWLVRGMFSHEILYNPSFCIALGMVIGLCLIKGVWPRRRRQVVWDRTQRVYATGLH